MFYDPSFLVTMYGRFCLLFSLLFLHHASSWTQPGKLPRTFTKHATSMKQQRQKICMSIKGPVRYSSADWYENLISLPSSRILARTKSSILSVTLWTTFLTYLRFSRQMFLARKLPSWIFSILGSALSLLLVFRTNSAYARFSEGRSSWSAVLVACRNIARQTSFLPKKFHSKIASLLVIFCITLKQHLQGERNIRELKPYFKTATMMSEDEKNKRILGINEATNRPLFTLLEIERTVDEALQESYKQEEIKEFGPLPKYIEKGFLDAYELLSIQIGVCEKLVKQPVPLSYSRHTSRFLTLYLYSLPIALVSELGLMTIPVITAISWSFLSIQEIGHFIEEPFNKELTLISLPQMVAVVCSDVSELLNGVFSDNEEIRALNEFLFRESINSSRTKNETDFIYYDESLVDS